jgi:hypothetical protein
MALDKFQRTLTNIDIDFTVDTGAVTLPVINDGGTGYIVGDKFLNGDFTITGAGTEPDGWYFVVGSVDANGAILTVATVVTDATSAADGGINAVFAVVPTEGLGDDYFDHDQYEEGGQIDEYKTGNGLIVIISESSGPITSLGVGIDGQDYRVGDRVSVSPSGSTGNGSGGIAVVTDVDLDGGVNTLSIEDGGDNYDDATDANTVFLTRKLKTTATGKYEGANADNDPTVSVGRLPDQAQWKVQKRYIDGGTIEVYAEPTTVNSVGDIVGNTIRAEDITDEYRCVSVYLSDGVTSRFEWVTEAGETGNKGEYGFCREVAAGSISTALIDADCPAGFVESTGSCVVVVYTTVNTDEGADTINAKEAYEQCFAAGNWYEPSAAKGSRCIEAVADNFSLDNFAFTTNSSAQDYAATVCQQMNFDWVKIDLGTPANNFSCFAKADVTVFGTQQNCADAGHVWVAGTCYNKADFGDGYSRQGNEGNTKNKLPK